MDEKTIEQLREYCKKRLGGDFDLLDFDQLLDKTLTYSEGKTELDEYMNKIIPSKEEIKDFKESEMKIKIAEISFKEKYLTERNILDKSVLDKFKTIAIYGDTGSGKTALAYKIIELFNDRPIFFVKHPKPEILRKLGYANIKSLEELEKLQDCVIYFDEPQLSLSLYDNHANRVIAKLCSLARQRNIKLIISSSDTRVFGKSNEAYFDLWLIKDVDYSMVKQGSKIKKAIKENTIFEPEGFKLEQDEFLVENRKFSELNGKQRFDLPKKWDKQLSEAYRNPQ